MSIINAYVVRDENGLNKDATVAKFLKDYDVFEAKERNDLETIGEAVMLALDLPKTKDAKSINMPALVTFTMMNLDVEANAVGFVQKRIGDYVHAHPELFHTAKGAGALTGVRILSRLNAAELADVQLQRAKAAEKAKAKLAAAIKAEEANAPVQA